MSDIPFSLSVGMSMEVPRNPVWRQLSCKAKFSFSRAIMASLASPSTILFLRANRAGVCMVFRISVLKRPSAVMKFFLM